MDLLFLNMETKGKGKTKEYSLHYSVNKAIYFNRYLFQTKRYYICKYIHDKKVYGVL